MNISLLTKHKPVYLGPIWMGRWLLCQWQGRFQIGKFVCQATKGRQPLVPHVSTRSPVHCLAYPVDLGTIKYRHMDKRTTKYGNTDTLALADKSISRYIEAQSITALMTLTRGWMWLSSTPNTEFFATWIFKSQHYIWWSLKKFL